jgi:chemotaxis protein CheX
MKQLNISEKELLTQLDKDVSEIFSTMVGTEVSPTSKQIDPVTHFKDCVTAMVGLAGVYNGLISISTPRKVAMGIASQMLGMDVPEMNEDVTDALGEIANMIGGSFKHHFVKDGHEVRLSTPSVITGEEYALTAGSLPDTLTLLFDHGDDHFMVSVYLEAGD